MCATNNKYVYSERKREKRKKEILFLENQIREKATVLELFRAENQPFGLKDF